MYVLHIHDKQAKVNKIIEAAFLEARQIYD